MGANDAREMLDSCREYAAGLEKEIADLRQPAVSREEIADVLFAHYSRTDGLDVSAIETAVALLAEFTVTRKPTKEKKA